MKPTVERLAEQFTKLVGPEAFAKAEAAIAAAKVAAEAAAKAAAEKAAAAAAAAKAAAAAATPALGARPSSAAPTAATQPAAGQPGSATPATPKPATPVVGARPPSAAPTTPTQTAAGGGRAPSTPAPAPRPAPAAPAARPATPAPAAAAAPAPIPTLPVQVTSHPAKGYHFDALVAPSQVVEAAQLLDADGFALDTITGVDWIAQNEMEIVYDYFHPLENLRVVVRARVPRATPELPSITAVYPGANWHERETHDFFGIRFTGHPNLKPFLLPEDANFHPLRKDYQP